MNELTHLDLFSGIGGFALAANAAGFRTVGFCEIEPYAQQVLKEKFGAVMADAEGKREHREHRDSSGANSAGHKSQQEFNGGSPRLHPDITRLDGRAYAGVSLLTGGFPCQPFSVAGKQLGKEDHRHLWPEMCRVISEARPTWIVGENVAGIVRMELDAVLADLENLGYSAQPIVVPACAVDARHRRDRVWILAHSDQRGLRRTRAPRDERHAAQRGQDVADAEHQRSKVRHAQCFQPTKQRETGDAVPCGSVVADANEPGPQGRNGTELRERGCERAIRASGPHCTWQDEREWFAESGMGRVSHGIPNRAHRLRALGNAIVPQVAYQILQGIAEIEMT